MRIPVVDGIPTLSASQLRAYGAVAGEGVAAETQRGCPAVYRARYVDRSLPDATSYPLAYGTLMHDVLARMDDGADPDEALAAAWRPDLPAEMHAEARADLDAYVARAATPTDRYLALDTEVMVTAHLGTVTMDDAECTIAYRGVLDWVGIDPDDPATVHVVDYKTNRHPATQAQVEADPQLASYAWLVFERAAMLWDVRPRRVVVHLDLIKWRDYETTYTRDDVAQWQAWALATAQGIASDTEGRPVVNAACPTCPLRDTCPAYRAMPESAALLAAVPAGDFADLARWRAQVGTVLRMLDSAARDADRRMTAYVAAHGPQEVAGDVYAIEPRWRSKADDVAALHETLGDADFYRIVSVSRTALERIRDQVDPSDYARAEACFSRQVTGEALTRKRG